MTARVYGAIAAVSAALAHDGIAKERLNARDDYLYRGIDDVVRRLAPLLAEHRLCILPRVIERDARDRTGEGGEQLVSVTVRSAFAFISAEDGSAHEVEAFGEALDASDKGTAKAMQSAYKYALLQTFCVPVPQVEDADARSHRLMRPSLPGEPAEGWACWAEARERELAACSTVKTINDLQDANRPLLAALAREQPALYHDLGRAISAHRAELAEEKTAASSGPPPKASAASLRRVTARQARSCANNGSAPHG